MLNYRETFLTIYHLARNNPALVILGFISVLIGEVFTTAVTLLAAASDFDQWSPEQFLTAVADLGNDIGQLLLYTAGITIILALIWVVTAICGAGLIVGTQERLEDRPFTLQDGFRSGRRFLWPFIAVDTIIFFPVFIIALLILLVIAGGLGIAVSNSQSASENDIITTILISLLCAIPFILLMIPAGFLTAVYRLIALRDVALNQAGIRQSIRNVWPLLKSSALGVLVLTVLTIALSGFPSALSQLAHTVLRLLPDIPRILIDSTLRLVTNTVIFTTVSMLWTIALRSWWTPAEQSIDAQSTGLGDESD